MTGENGQSSNFQELPLELLLELEMVKVINAGLREYLEHVRNVKRNLSAIHINFKLLAKVNQDWVDNIKNN
ncbi:hypothetical protein K1T71_014086 [Dendrolimus kikuchii]|uniref:Uncharacterized protein n=1 Tax=Dendrolimus kikuchii TaxID=765133 RepID=A0ACC1CF59_9NEOP|nr:hypothetical protein K1T71_014086 [Dendrolimus kikuchii]